MIRISHVSRMFAVLVALLLGPAADAASFTGKVLLPDGQPAAGAMLTVFDAKKERRETVYTAPDGTFAIRTPYAGALTLRARLSGFADVTRIESVALDATAAVEITLKAFASRDQASEALSASAFNARLPWHDVQRDRPAFVSQCNYCHQMGNASTRIPQSHKAWMETLDKMEDGLFAMLSVKEKSVVADVLARGFDGRPIEARQNYGASADLARAKVREWLVGDGGTFIHDAMVGRDQKVYGTDEGHDLLWVLDPKTGGLEKYALPEIDLPRGGHFAGMKLPIGTFAGKHGPHSMAESRDGRIWITNALSTTLMSFDPVTKRFKSYPIGNDSLYPHTLRVDRNDVVWFTMMVSNQVGRFDIKTETMTVLDLPANGLISWVSTLNLPTLMRISSWFPDHAMHIQLSTHRYFGHSVVPFPYGIDIHPADGGVWYAKLHTAKIGRIDPKTLAIKEWDTPLKGPRRPRFDAKGILWIPSFDEGALMRFDPASQSFETFKIPPVGEGEYETPYALAVAPDTGDIWLSANNSDRVLRFSPVTKTFASYPSPTRVTVLRDFSFAADGTVCTSSSNLPAAAIEDGRPSFMCIEPEGSARDRAAIAAPAR